MSSIIHIGAKTVVQSFAWKLLERLFTQGLSLVIQIILARILLPSDFGTIAIILAIINYAGLFVQSGLSAAVIQKKDLDNSDAGTLLTASLLVATILYFFLFFFAPFIARCYENDSIIWPLRVISLSLFLYGYNSVQTALYYRNMRFRSLFYRSSLAIPLSGAIAIGMAYFGMGIWALVAYTLVNIVTIVLFMAFDSKVKVHLSFSLTKAKQLYSFSSKILMANLISGAGDTIRTMLIGKKYNTINLAYYDKAYTYSSYITQSITVSLSSVLLPTFSREQEDIDHLKSMARRSVRMTCFLVLPVLASVMVMAKPLVILLLTEKWAPSIPYLIIFCLLRIPGCIVSIDKQVFYAIGNSAINMYYEFFLLIANLISLIITIPMGIMAIAVGATIVEFLGCFVLFCIGKRLYHYGIKSRIEDIFPPLLYTLLMVGAMIPISFLGFSPFLSIVIQMAIGLIVYIGISLIVKDKSLQYIFKIFRNNK